MTKRQLVQELHNCGFCWATMEYTKQELQEFLDGYKKAASMSMEELEQLLKSQGKL